MLRSLFVLSILSVCLARPHEFVRQNIIGLDNTNDAPIKSPSDLEAQNMITVPPNCPPGQQWINGQCRDVWRGGALADSEDFRKLLEDAWAKSAHVRNSRQVEEYDDTLPAFNVEDDPTRNIISVPNQCPEGYKPDAYGICRKQL